MSTTESARERKTAGAFFLCLPISGRVERRMRQTVDGRMERPVEDPFSGRESPTGCPFLHHVDFSNHFLTIAGRSFAKNLETEKKKKA